MDASISRRALVAIALASAARQLGDRRTARQAPAPTRREVGADPRLIALERRYGGRLGVCVRDAGGVTRLAHRADERFPMLSTFKFLAAALVLQRVDAGDEHLDRRIIYGRDALVPYAPVTERHAGDAGMTIRELCHAAVTVSDNTAGNLLLDSFGGPAGLTAFARSIGDPVSRLDRIEVALNEAAPGDPRDTTTPAAMARDMSELLAGPRLSIESRNQLAEWLMASTTGGSRIRAGLPAGWRVGDKTGTSGNGAANDIAVVWPPGRPPFFIAAYYAESTGSPEGRNDVLAEVGRIAASVT